LGFIETQLLPGIPDISNPFLWDKVGGSSLLTTSITYIICFFLLTFGFHTFHPREGGSKVIFLNYFTLFIFCASQIPRASTPPPSIRSGHNDILRIIIHRIIVTKQNKQFLGYNTNRKLCNTNGKYRI
jgi:hypothetical protein